jgi:hypothetical protein
MNLLVGIWWRSTFSFPILEHVLRFFNRGINLVFSHRLGTICDYFEIIGRKSKKLQIQVLKKLLTLYFIFGLLVDR